MDAILRRVPAVEPDSAESSPARTSGRRRARDAHLVGPRESRRLQRIETSRAQILDVAEVLFGQGGYQGTGIDQIASGSEFSVGAVYTFFGGKEDIFCAVLDRRGDALIAAMRECSVADLPGEEKLAHLVRTVIGFYRAWPHFGRLSGRALALGREAYPDSPAAANGIAEAQQIYRVVVEEGQQQGVFRQANADHLAGLIMAMVFAQTRLDPELSGDPNGLQLDLFVTMLLGALRA